MEKMKKLLLENIEFILFSVFFACFVGFMFLPLFNVYEFDGTTNTISLANLVSGGTFGSLNLLPDGIFIFILVSVLVSVILVAICTVFSQKRLKKYSSYLKGFSILFLLIALFYILLSESYINDIEIGGVAITAIVDELEFNALGLAFIIVALVLMILCLLRKGLSEIKFSVSEIVEIAILIALAIGLDKIKLFSMPTGGSVNLAGIPLLIIAIRHGPAKGLISASVIFGILSCLIDGYGFQTYPFDYFIAFSGYALCGLCYKILAYVFRNFQNKKKTDLINIMISFTVGAIGVFATRMIGSTISSMIYYGLDLNAALIYNVGYTGVSAAICLAACLVLSAPIAMVNRLFPVNRNNKNTHENSEEGV